MLSFNREWPNCGGARRYATVHSGTAVRCTAVVQISNFKASLNSILYLTFKHVLFDMTIGT